MSKKERTSVKLSTAMGQISRNAFLVKND